MTQRVRRAGISVPLFSLRSSRSWGIGEIGDIPAFASWLGRAHQSMLQILPINELASGEPSPYSALSAMAIDPQFISISLLGGGAALEDDLAAEIDDVRRTPRVDYARVRWLKNRALRITFERFLEVEWVPETGSAADLRDFIHREAWWLDEYSLYRALRAEAEERPWMEWPIEVRDRHAAALDAARRRLAREILFFQYVQWIAARQWQMVRRAARGIQILGDLPFMVTLDSADVWSRREEFILDASVGTPPDAFSETGQEWGLPPYDWNVARANDFAWLRMRAQRLADLFDGFRVDHLVGFYRTYVRPLDGGRPYFMPPDEPDQRALGETTMNIITDTGADVSVEDLGTVPDFVRESIARLGLPGYKVLRWEPGDPAAYPRLSVAMTGTHDTETLAVWWESLSPKQRQRFGAVPTAFDASVRDEILARMYNSGSDLLLLPIQDVFGWRERINQPATVGDANWTFVLPWPVERMMSEPDARERARQLAEWSDSSGRWNPPALTET